MNPPIPLPELLTVREVAAKLRLSVPMVFKLIRSGDLEVCRFGKSLRVPVDDVIRFVAERRQRGGVR